MFVTPHFIPRGKKEWIPLATQQLRLRNLIKILVFKIENDKNDTLGTKVNNDIHYKSKMNNSYYFTLHATTMSAPFYTSEKVKSDSPKWKELEMASWEGIISNSVDAVVIRLWLSNSQETEDKVLAVWGIYLSGLIYLGPTLRSDIPLKSNALVVLMSGGYFTPPQCLEKPNKIRYISVIVRNCDVRPGYSVNSVTRLQTLQHVIKKEVSEAEILKKKISMGDYLRSENRGRTTLRKLLNRHKPKTNHSDVVKTKESLEITQYRVNILKEERDIIMNRIKELNKAIELMSESNQTLESKIMENYRILKRNIYCHREWKKAYVDRREKYLHSKAMLNFRTKQLISELNLIYPIQEVSPEKYTICGVHLPNSEDFAGHDDLQVSIALGFVTHVVQMISVFLQIPLRYPVVHFGSRSKIVDQITDISDSEREFCLFVKGKERSQFNYAVYLLNKNIAQLRWLCGLPTSDLRKTLENLSSLVKMKFGSTTLDLCNKSLSSSTADLCSSNLSVSCPIGSVMSFQLKQQSRTHHMSESGAEFYSRPVNSSVVHTSRHKISKSIGCAKELMTNAVSAKKKNSQININHLNSNLSCSLDKGLNEYEDIAHTNKEQNDNQYSSEPTLHSLHKSTKIEISEVEDKFLKTVNQESQKVFSDGSLEVNTTENSLISNASPKIYRTTHKELHNKSSADSKSDCESAVEALTEGLEDITTKLLPKQDIHLSLQNPSPSNLSNTHLHTDLSSEKEEFSSQNPMILTDSLLENVTSRTEALVSQSTCFNRFRSRLKSTVESSN